MKFIYHLITIAIITSCGGKNMDAGLLPPPKCVDRTAAEKFMEKCELLVKSDIPKAPVTEYCSCLYDYTSSKYECDEQIRSKDFLNWCQDCASELGIPCHKLCQMSKIPDF